VSAIYTDVMKNAMRRRLLGVSLLVALLLTAGIAYASIPGPDGVIHGCYKTANPAKGSLIAIDSAASCPSGYTALNWSQTGPAGPQGPAGADGVSGHEVVIQAFSAPANQVTSAAVACPTGKKVTGGGYTVGSTDPAVEVRDSAPQTPANIAWVVSVRNGTGSDVGGNQVFAVCVTAI
jgi:hypothetical protein